MTMTYSEARQRAYLKCSRELRAVACQILDDVQNEVELNGRNAPWALQLAVTTAKQAREIESLGYAQCLLYPQTVGATMRSQDGYHKALDAFHSRLAQARGISTIEANELSKSWLKPPAGFQDAAGRLRTLSGPDYTTGPDRDEAPRDAYSGDELEL